MSNLFCGIIPSQILSNTKLSQTEKLIYGIVSGFNYNNKTCTASNATIGSALGISAGRASKAIHTLAKLNLINVQMVENSNRTIFVNLEFDKLADTTGLGENNEGGRRKQLGGWSETTRGVVENDYQINNIKNNIKNNKEINIYTKFENLNLLENLKNKTEEELQVIKIGLGKLKTALDLELTTDGYLISNLSEYSNLRLDLAGFATTILKYKNANLRASDLVEAMQLLNGYISNSIKGKKYKDHNAVLRGWVLDQILKTRTLKHRSISAENWANESILKTIKKY